MTSISSTLLLVLVILLIGFIGYLVILLFKHKQEKSEAEVEKASLYSTLDAIEKNRTELQSKIATLEEQISVAHNEKLQLVSDLNVQKNTNLNYENELTELRRLNQELDKECLRQNIRVPEDVSIIGYDDIPAAETTTPSLTTIKQDRLDLGKNSYAALYWLIAKVPISRSLLRPQLIIRNSTGTTTLRGSKKN